MDALELERRYLRLKAKVKDMMTMQKLYFRTRDPQTLVKSKELEKEVWELIDPKPTTQLPFEFLAQ